MTQEQTKPQTKLKPDCITWTISGNVEEHEGLTQGGYFCVNVAIKCNDLDTAIKYRDKVESTCRDIRKELLQERTN